MDEIIVFKPGNKLLKRSESFKGIKGESNSSDLLDYVIKLAPQKLIRENFPYAYSTSSHWIYYCLYSSDLKLKKEIGNDLLKSLDAIDRKNAGIGRKSANRANALKLAKSRHPKIGSVEFDDKKCSKLVRDFIAKKISKQEIEKLKKHWIKQSKLTKKMSKKFNVPLSERIKELANQELDDDQKKVILAYSLIRALYGTTFITEKDPNEEMESDDTIKEYVEISKKLLKKLKLSATFPYIKELNSEVGHPALSAEAVVRKKEGQRVLKDFRLGAYYKTLKQLCEDKEKFKK